MPSRSSEKRKQTEDETTAAESPRKRPLNDAFKSLSIQAKHIRHLAESQGSNAIAQDVRTIESKTQQQAYEDDVVMRENASYAKDAHTIVVTSLDDDSDVEAPEDEPLYVFNLPGSIDTTFSGTKSIPAALLEQHREPANQQMVLYRGTPSEVVERSIATDSASMYQKPGDTGDAMDID